MNTGTFVHKPVDIAADTTVKLTYPLQVTLVAEDFPLQVDSDCQQA